MFHRNVPLREANGNIVKWYGSSLDIEDRKQAEVLLSAEKRLLEMTATDVPLERILNDLCLFIEERRSGTLASVLLLNPDGVYLSLRCRTPYSLRVEAADGKAANWAVCRLVRHRGIHEIAGHRLRHRDGPAVGGAGAPRFSTEAWAASFVVKSGTLFERKSPGDLLHVLSRTAES